MAASPTCSWCNGRLLHRDERQDLVCSRCQVATWSPEKRRAIGRLLAVGLKPSTDAEKDAAVAEALKHLPDNNP